MGTHGSSNGGFPDVPVSIAQITLWVCSTVIFFGSAVWFPIVGIFLSLLTPVPSSFSIYQWGVSRGYVVPLASFIVSFVVFYFAGIASVVSYLFTLLLMGMSIGYFARQCASREFTVSVSAFIAFITGMAIFWYKHQGPDVSLFQDLENKTFSYIIALLKEAGVEGADKPFVRDQIKATVHTAVRLLPGAFLGSLLFAGAINTLGIVGFSARKGLPAPPWEKPTKWRSPDWLVWPVICFGFALLVSSSVRLVALNVLIVLVVIYFLQGLSILGFYAEKLSVPLWVRILVIVLVLVQQYLSLLVAAVGFFDVWFDFRKIIRERREI